LRLQGKQVMGKTINKLKCHCISNLQWTYLSRPGIRFLQAHICVKLLEFRVNASTWGVEEPARPKWHKIIVSELNKIMWSSDSAIKKDGWFIYGKQK
jgi:hypothetical protein